MHHALRSSLAIFAIIACAGCQTHDRRMYSVHRDKNMRVPSPWSASTTRAADEATAPIDASSSAGGDSSPAPDSSGAPPAQ